MGTIDWNAEDALIFGQVVAAGSFTAAARVLDLPKSTVSRRVSRLEEGLGVQLLRRTTRRLDLTDAGRAFSSRVAEAADSLKAAELAATSMLDEPRGRLRVTAPVELGTRTFNAMLAFGQAYPELQLDLELSNRYVNLIEEGFDVALRGGRPPEGSLTGRPLGGSTDLRMVASPDYLERNGTPQRARDFARHECILFPAWTSNSSWSLSGPRGKTVIPVKGRLTINNLDAIRVAALRGLGIALLPDGHCEGDLQEGTLMHVLPTLSMPTSGLWVVYSRTRFLSAKVRAFADFMCGEFEAC